MSNVKSPPRTEPKVLARGQLSIVSEKGAAALIAVLLVLFGSLALVGAFSSMTLNEIKVSRNQTKSLQTYYAAEGGVEDLIYRIKTAKNYDAAESFSLNGANVNINTTDVSGTKEIVAQGGLNNFFRSVASKIKITSQQIQFHYGVQVGAGGLELKQNSSVQGNIYSNGPLTGETNSYITGDAFAATSLTQSDSHIVQNSDQSVGQSSPQLDVAQSFKASFTGQIGQISLYFKKIGAPADKTVRIMSDSGGNPNKNGILASGTLSASLVTGSYGWINVTFSLPANVNNNTTYWVMIDSSVDASKYYVWGKDSNQGFGNGVAKYSSDWSVKSPTWTTITGDLDFKIWQGGINSISGIAVYGDARANTITNSQVCGKVYYQTIDSTSLNFVNNPGSPCPTPYTPGTAYPGSSDPGPENMPISDANIQEWRDQAQAGGIFSDSAHCTPANGAVIGPARLDCDFTVENGKTITIKAPVWVKGNILMDNNVVVVLDSSYGSLSGVIMADDQNNPATVGKINTKNNTVICGSTGYNAGNGDCNLSNGSYLMLLSTYSGSDKAIKIENNVKGAIFYASAGIAAIENNTRIKEVIAYKIELENNAQVVYEQGLANAQFSSGPGASYEILEWKETE